MACSLELRLQPLLEWVAAKANRTQEGVVLLRDCKIDL